MKPWAEWFYNSGTWREDSKEFLKSKGYLCERCSKPDNPVVAKIAHHKVYLTRENINDPYISLAWDNLEALCQDCHNKEHHKSKKTKRYFFDEAGNIVYTDPPHSEKQKNIFEHRAWGITLLRRGAHNGCTCVGVW